MSLMCPPDARQSVFAEAMLSVLSAKSDNSFLRVDREVSRLGSVHPGSSVSFHELKEYMLGFAVRERVAT